MNRNTESHFAELPQVDIGRSIFDRSSGHKTSFNVGDLIPFYWDEVLPGDTFNVTTSAVVRLQTLLTPIMDNAYMDTYWFYVPARLTMTHFPEFMGQNSSQAWLPNVEYPMPVVKAPSGGFAVGTIADYMGIPPGVEYPDEDAPIALPLRAYALICNEWFRDQNVTDPLNIPLDETDVTGVNTGSDPGDVAKGGLPFKAAKYHDYFTSSLKAPQRGPSVGFDFAASFTGHIPVIGSDDNFEAGDEVVGKPIHFLGHSQTDPDKYINLNGVHNAIFSGTSLAYQSGSGTASGVVFPANLVADPTGAAISGLSFTINELRLAFQLQKFYEKQARSGVRIREIVQEMFGVTMPDYRAMIPEYLGGHRFPLAIHQVANQTQGVSDFLGDLGAMSNTSDVHADFVKSFTEHGYVIGVCCVRYDHTYPQGLERSWSRKGKFDYYWPVFANLGERATLAKEIYLTDDKDANNAAFGYNEQWAEYRYKPSRVSAELRPGVPNSLATWHLADHYATMPTLSDSWIREDKANVDRVLAVTSAVSNQVFCDFWIENKVTRPLPMYSIPGLIDHH